MIHRNSESGSAAIESIVGTTLAVTALVGGLALAYSAFAHAWLKRSAYEASICLSTSQSTYSCEKALRSDVSQALPVGSLTRISLRRSGSKVETDFYWRVGRNEFGFNDVRALPLLDRSTRRGHL